MEHSKNYILIWKLKSKSKSVLQSLILDDEPLEMAEFDLKTIKEKIRN